MARRSRARSGVAIGLVVALGIVSGSAPVWPKASESGGIGVAPLEWAGPVGNEVPDLGQALAQRLAEQGLGRVVGPRELGAVPGERPSVETLRRWGSAAQVGGIVTGRAARVGERTSIVVRLRAARDGTRLATWTEEAPRPEALDAALDRLAARIAQDVRAPAPPATASVAAAPPSAAPAASAEDTAAATAAAPMLSLRADRPLSIRADELEAFEEGGGRRLLFQRNVRVAQEGVELTADRLEAFYPRGESEPERLVARGHVVVAQRDPDRSMRCREATYFRQEQRVLCSGSAELRQREDRVRGERIEIFLDSGRVRVSGGAEVSVRGETAAAVGGAQ